MEDRDDEDSVLLHREEDYVWKPPKDGSPIVTHGSREFARILGYCIEYREHCGPELLAETGRPVLVEVRRIVPLFCRFWQKGDRQH